LAESMGMKVECRPVPVEELSEFDEVGACGTAAVITPFSKVVDEDQDISYTFGDPEVPGPVITRLYDTLVGIQNGDLEDSFGWTKILD